MDRELAKLTSQLHRIGDLGRPIARLDGPLQRVISVIAHSHNSRGPLDRVRYLCKIYGQRGDTIGRRVDVSRRSRLIVTEDLNLCLRLEPITGHRNVALVLDRGRPVLGI